MEKFKYIIIFTLILVLGLTYYQSYEYKQISQTLISENNKLDDNNNKLEALNSQNQDLIKGLNETIEKQNQQIVSLKQNISSLLGSQPDNEQTVFETEIFEEYDDLMNNLMGISKN
jgi:uncharacterized protein HemX